MAKRISLEAKLYYGTAGSTASTEIDNVRDVTFTGDFDEIDVSTRGNTYKDIRLGQGSLQIEFEMIENDSDATLTALKAAWAAKTTVALRTRAYSSGWGIDADFKLQSMTAGEPLNDAQTKRFVAMLDQVNRAPTIS